MTRSAVAVLASLLLAGVGCGGADDAIDVFAASSLTGALVELEAAYEAHADVDVRLNLAGSSALREQLRDGATADVFIAANPAILDALIGDGTIDASPVVLAENRLVLAVPFANPAGVESLDDLANDGLLVGVCAEGVPCGDLAAHWLADAGVRAVVDTAEPNARSLAQRLMDGELDAALVYASDVASAPDDLREIVVTEAGPVTTYPMAALTARGAAFTEFLAGDTAAATLRRAGFEVP